MLSEKYEKKIKNLSHVLWENKINIPDIENWLDNFEPAFESDERLFALYLLSNFMYFGNSEMRHLLKVMFNEYVKNQVISRIRKENEWTKNGKFIQEAFEEELNNTRFIGIGNPSESGNHLLYYFRQENKLSKKLFIDQGSILNFKVEEKSKDIDGKDRERSVIVSRAEPKVKRYVFIDDFCGSGSQSKGYASDIIPLLKEIDSDIELYFFLLFGSTVGLDAIRSRGYFDKVEAVCEIDDSYKVFSGDRFFYDGVIDKVKVKQMCVKYGKEIYSMINPLGYRGGEYLIGFSHNIPDNTLPIIWSENKWTPIFKRYDKVY